MLFFKGAVSKVFIAPWQKNDNNISAEGFNRVVDQYGCCNNHIACRRLYPVSEDDLWTEPACLHPQMLWKEVRLEKKIWAALPNHTAVLLLLYFSWWHITFSPGVYVGFQLVISLVLSVVKIWLYNVHQLQAVIAQGYVGSVGAVRESGTGNVLSVLLVFDRSYREQNVP